MAGQIKKQTLQIVQYIKDNQDAVTCGEVAAHFEVSKAVITNLISRYNLQGFLAPEITRGKIGTDSSLKGVPDIIAIVKGQFVGVEIKFGKDKLSPDQILFKRFCEHAGGTYLVIKTVEEVDNFLLTV